MELEGKSWQIVYRRGPRLYAAVADRRGVRSTRQLAEVPTLAPVEPDREAPLWAISPDRRRIAFQGRRLINQSSGEVLTRTIQVAPLDNPAKYRTLFTVDGLRSAQGQAVVNFSPFERLPHQAKTYPLPEARIYYMWGISALHWSRDGKRLYVSLYYESTLGGYATCAVDAQTGRAVTDAGGNWRRLLPTRNVAENTRYLVGCGLGRTLDEPEVANASSKYYPLYCARKRRDGQTSTPVSLLPARFRSKNKPPYAFAHVCAIEPEGERIAFFSNHELWLTTVHGRNFIRLITLPGEVPVSRLTWAGGNTLLYRRGSSVWAVTLNATNGTKLAEAPRLLLNGVDDFQALPG